MKDYLTIGELATIFDMDVQTLRHYDTKGILVPSYRDDSTRWRLYRFDQIYALATIRYLRKLGYSIKGIKSFMEAEDSRKAINTLREQAILLRKQCDEWIATADTIQKNLDFIEEEKPTEDSVYLRTFGERTFVHIGGELDIFTHELLYFYPTACFYSDNNHWFAAYILEDGESRWQKFSEQAKIMPAGEYLCGFHFGHYNTIRDSINNLYEQGANYKLADTVVTINIIDQMTESHPEHYVTSLQIQILGSGEQT